MSETDRLNAELMAKLEEISASLDRINANVNEFKDRARAFIEDVRESEVA
jgi:hypothetical protein